jgi:HAD superfamily hydrolase (TIGR01509 family)
MAQSRNAFEDPSTPGLGAVLWDMDGTLVRTEELWMSAETATMAAFGSHWDAQDQAVAIGGPLDRVVRYMAERVGRPEAEVGRRLTDEIERLVATEDIPWMPGARELHEALTAGGVPQALVSNSWRELMDAALAELHTSFDVLIAGDEVARGKPDPLPYLLACESLGVAPATAVVIEDSPTGVAAGLAAGCAVLAVPNIGELPPAAGLTITATLADWRVSDLAALVTR